MAIVHHALTWNLQLGANCITDVLMSGIAEILLICDKHISPL